MREYLRSRIKYLETKSKNNNIINDSGGRNGRKFDFFFHSKE